MESDRTILGISWPGRWVSRQATGAQRMYTKTFLLQETFNIFRHAMLCKSVRYNTWYGVYYTKFILQHI